MTGQAWNRYKQFAVVFIIAAILTSCGEEISSESSSSSSTVENPAVGVVQETAFYVRLFDLGTFPYYMSKMGDFSTSCSIAAGKTGQALDCVLDINELDLYYNGISLQYNVPSTMCNYVQFNTYWYYNYEVGTGPSEVTVNQTQDQEGNVLSNSCVIDGTTVASCAGTEVAYNVTENSFSCAYNYSTIGGPNCCMGTYTKTLNITVSGGSSTTSTTNESWGGSVQACLGGAGKTNWEKYTKSGYPAGIVYYTPSKGLNEKYQITAPINSMNAGSNFPIANFYTSSKHSHTGYGGSSRTSTIPYIVDPVDDRSGSSVVSGNPAYTWRCLDKNSEVINQINLYVRDWNTYSEFVKYGTTSGASGDPDITGDEGTTCDYMSSGSDCNDFSDLDDRSANSYNSTTKPTLFPKETL